MPEAADFMGKAHRLLTEAGLMLGMGLYEAAGRTAYMAGFHAAQALIFQREQRSVKTHQGVHVEFQRLVRDDASLDPALRSFLSWAYNMKATADYEPVPTFEVTAERATKALDLAKRLVTHVAALLPNAPPEP